MALNGALRGGSWLTRSSCRTRRERCIAERTRAPHVGRGGSMGGFHPRRDGARRGAAQIALAAPPAGLSFVERSGSTAQLSERRRRVVVAVRDGSCPCRRLVSFVERSVSSRGERWVGSPRHASCVHGRHSSSAAPTALSCVRRGEPSPITNYDIWRDESRLRHPRRAAAATRVTTSQPAERV